MSNRGQRLLALQGFHPEFESIEIFKPLEEGGKYLLVQADHIGTAIEMDVNGNIGLPKDYQMN